MVTTNFSLIDPVHVNVFSETDFVPVGQVLFFKTLAYEPLFASIVKLFKTIDSAGVKEILLPLYHRGAEI